MNKSTKQAKTAKNKKFKGKANRRPGENIISLNKEKKVKTNPNAKKK